MNAGVIFGCAVVTVMLLILYILSILVAIKKRKIKNNITVGTKFIFYGTHGNGNPFKDPNITFTIIDVCDGYVLYKCETKATKLQPSILEFTDERTCSIKDFVNCIYKLVNVKIVNQ